MTESEWCRYLELSPREFARIITENEVQPLEIESVAVDGNRLIVKYVGLKHPDEFLLEK